MAQADAGRTELVDAPSPAANLEVIIDEYPNPFVHRVVLKNYKSIADADIELRPLTMLVGANGSGKSNFVDALRITTDALNTNLENALRERGGISEVRRRSRGHPTHFGIRLDLNLGDGWTGSYAYSVSGKESRPRVSREECHIERGARRFSYSVQDGKVEILPKGGTLPPFTVATNSLALSVLGTLPPFQVVRDGLGSMGFYSLNPQAVRELQDPDPGSLLRRDGGNLAAVIRTITNEDPSSMGRIIDYLSTVVPGSRDVSVRSLGPKDTIEFRQDVEGDSNPWKFLAANVSDGTLRALGVLTAAFQDAGSTAGIPLIAIEEPETAIHPGASTRLMDALLEAATTKQVLLTTHSPDLLNHQALDVDSLVAVEASGGRTSLGPITQSLRNAVTQQLFTPGELLRLEQLEPDHATRDVQAKLF